jgi:hypothetical protein
MPRLAERAPHKAATFPPPGVGELDDNSEKYSSSVFDRFMSIPFLF